MAAKLVLLAVLALLLVAVAVATRSGTGRRDVPAAQVVNAASRRGDGTALQKLQVKVGKLNRALSHLEKTLATKYLKISAANASFLKTADANAVFVRISDAIASFLKTADANATFLKIGGTAANSQAVGGVTIHGLIQGKGQVLSGAATGQAGADTQLLGDGSVRVLVGVAGAGQPQIKLANDTSSSISFTVVGGSSPSNTISPGGQAVITPSAGQIDVQMFSAGGGAGIGRIWTATVSETGSQFFGQMLIGLL